MEKKGPRPATSRKKGQECPYMVFLHPFWKWAAPEELVCLNTYISLQGCNYFDISVSSSQSHNAELVIQPASSAVHSDITQGMLNKQSRRPGTEGELPKQEIQANISSC